MPRIVVIIPARYGSSRLPGKPLMDICGEPMICHVYKRALAVDCVDMVAVATDDELVAACVKDMGGTVCLTDSSHASGTDRIAQAARDMGLSRDTIVVNIQGDQPLISREAVTGTVKLLDSSSKFSMSTAACPLDFDDAANPNRVKVIVDRHSRAIYFSRFPIPYDRDGCSRVSGSDSSSMKGYLRHIGIYAYRQEFLQEFVSLPPSWLEEMEKLEQLRAVENGCGIGVALVQEAPLDVDTEEDLRVVRRMLDS